MKRKYPLRSTAVVVSTMTASQIIRVLFLFSLN